MILLALMLAFAPDASAARPRKSRKKAATEAKAPAKKKSAYEKFVGKKGLTKAGGMITIYKDKEDLYLEIPDSLMGRKLIVSTIVNNSTDPSMDRYIDISSSPVYVVSKTDSLILFQKPGELFSTAPLATQLSFPIKYRNTDSTSFVIKATKVFNPASKSVASMNGRSLGGMATISSTSYKSESSRFISLFSQGNSIGIRREATFALAGSLMGFEFKMDNFCPDITTTLTLLPEGGVAFKEADNLVGTRNKAYTRFTDDRGTKNGKMATRWNLEGDRQIMMYVDTTFSPVMKKAVEEGVLAWNEAFKEAGLGAKIVTMPLGSDVNIYDPTVSAVFSTGAKSTSAKCKILTSPEGEILSARIYIPYGIIDDARRQGMLQIADVDSRYAAYDIPEDAVADVVRARTMSLMGLALGLDRNGAGSYAYSPDQLRSPAFTQKYGITASVTDNVLFNVLARRGDRERGVVTIVDRIGTYDKYAISWLYAGKDADPSQLYVPLEAPYADYRGLTGDLGSDIFAYADASVEHLHFAVDNMASWIKDVQITDERKALFGEYCFLRYYDIVNLLHKYVGGVVINDVREGSSAPKCVPVAEEMQKKCMKKSAEVMDDMTYINSSEGLHLMMQAHKSVDNFVNAYRFSLGSTFERLSFVAQNYVACGSSYSPEQYMKDMCNVMMRNVSRGKLLPAEDFAIQDYLAFLIRNNEILAENYAIATHKSNTIAATTPYTSAGARFSYDYPVLSYNAMLDVEKALKKGIAAASDSQTRSKMEFLLKTAQAALHN